ncbi:NAD(P)/FAD-dependent oxidoreductase [Rubritalea spongiae]|uniref:NAD(P)/FAD-dependent oxidoreductase n=1 Tax=Rubritalea spongiae TaxID=430797 RepID=A0ABW5E9V0_9BACT
MTQVDYIIVGQGLAGSALAMALLKRGKSLLVIDRNDPDAATRVAAGLVTTLAGKGMNPAWRQAVYLPEALCYYRALEGEAGCQLFYPHPVLRLFSNEKEAAKFERKKETVAEWVAEEKAEISQEQVHGSFGGFEMAQGGRLDTRKYLAVVRAKLERESRFIEANFDENDLVYEERKVIWKDYSAQRVILCQGYAGLKTGAFSYVPHRSAKGEMLTVKVGQLDSDRILNRNGWLVPLGNNEWRAGATYEWDDLRSEQTIEGREAVEKKVRDLTPLAFKTVEHEVGVRPIIHRSQPVIGFHPENEALGFFNGLGSKGVITAPSVAEHFAAVLEGEVELDPELALSRL